MKRFIQYPYAIRKKAIVNLRERGIVSWSPYFDENDEEVILECERLEQEEQTKMH